MPKKPENQEPTANISLKVVGTSSPATKLENLTEEIRSELNFQIPQGTEALDERLTACLEQLRGDFDRGIVLIDDETTQEQYVAALKADKTAGQKWGTLEARLRADGAKLLKKAAAMPEGACLIGVYPDGTLAIRQRSREIMNARRDITGKLRLLPHAEAVALRFGNEWGKVGEVVRAVRMAGYFLPPDSPSHEKKGLVAASEAVMGGNYVESPVTRNPYDRESRVAMLHCSERIPDCVWVRVVVFDHNDQTATKVKSDMSGFRSNNCGAILWLRG